MENPVQIRDSHRRALRWYRNAKGSMGTSIGADRAMWIRSEIKRKQQGSAKSEVELLHSTPQQDQGRSVNGSFVNHLDTSTDSFFLEALLLPSRD